MTAPAIWAVIPAAGRGARFGGAVPKQYLEAAGQPLIAHALDALAGHPRVAGVMVALAHDDPHWPGWTQRHGKPVLRCTGGGERADSVLAALQALPDEVGADALVLVHDAARPNLQRGDLDRLIEAASIDADGAILAAPVRDTLKRAGGDSRTFLRHCNAMLGERGWRLGNADITVVCERPRVGPHSQAMRELLAADLGVAVDAISVKATTSETLGFTGRGEGIAAMAACLLVGT